MWRTVVILLLLGLLVVSSGANLFLARQTLEGQTESDRLRQRAVAAETTRGALQTQLEQAKAQGAAAVGSATPGVPAPTVATVGPDRALLQRIEAQVSQLRGLQSKSDVPLKVLDETALRQYFLSNFERDYLPTERESDQKLLTTLGLLRSNETVVQILLDVLQEQVIGVYNEEEKAMYLVADSKEFGPDEQDTFAHEYAHVLQDQYYDLTKLAPKHPDNDDRSLAAQALIEGDAVLIQRLWAQENLTPEELNRLGQGGGTDSKLFSAPLFIREQLLFPYGDGFNFVRRLYQTGGGYRAVDEAFKNPPDSTEQILHPEKYRTREKPVEVDLPDLAGSMGAGWRKINSNVLGELDIRLTLEQLTDAGRAARGSSGWGGDRWMLLEKDGQQALVFKSVWDSETDARNFFDTFGLAMRNRFSGARQDESSPVRQALTAPTNATELRRSGQTVVAVISFDRPTAEALAGAVPVP